MDIFKEQPHFLVWAEMSTDEKREYLKSHPPDCSFLVGQETNEIATVKSYKSILSSVSPVFDRMFLGDFKESVDPVAIPIVDVCASDFKKFLTYIISETHGPLKLTVDSMINQAALGKKYMVPSAVAEFTALIEDHANTVKDFDLIKCLAHAIENDDKDLVDLCSERIISSNFRDYLMPSFIYDLNIKTFHFLLNLLKEVQSTPEKTYYLVSKVHLTPEEVFYHVANYAKVQHLKRNRTLDDALSYDANNTNLDLLLKLVEFENMSPREFCIGPGNSNLLDAEEKFEILKSLCLKNPESE